MKAKDLAALERDREASTTRGALLAYAELPDAPARVTDGDGWPAGRRPSKTRPRRSDAHLARRRGIPLAFDEVARGRLLAAGASPSKWTASASGNRFCILPMEGWDGTREGEPSDLTRRRWRNFGLSGAKLIWGGEAVAVRAGRPRQPQPAPHRRSGTRPRWPRLREALVAAHTRALRPRRRRRPLRRAAAHALRPLRAPHRRRTGRSR